MIMKNILILVAAPFLSIAVSGCSVPGALLELDLNPLAVESEAFALSAGKSAVQNEVVGDLQAEFGSGLAGTDSVAEIAERRGVRGIPRSPRKEF